MSFKKTDHHNQSIEDSPTEKKEILLKVVRDNPGIRSTDALKLMNKKTVLNYKYTTVNRYLRMLVDEGYITTTRNRGTLFYTATEDNQSQEKTKKDRPRIEKIPAIYLNWSPPQVHSSHQLNMKVIK